MEHKNNATTNKQVYLSKENSECLKGIFSICVLLHHLYQYSGLLHNTLPGAGLQFLGYFSVAVFFFLSGYGLMYSLQRKGEAYMSTFPKKRILPFYATIVLLTIIYAAYKLFMGSKLELWTLIRSLSFGGTLIINGWYLQSQLLFYIIFYLAFRFCKKMMNSLILTTTFVTGYVLTMAFTGGYPTLFVSSPLFVIGLWYSYYKDNLDSYIGKAKHRFWLFMGFGVVLAVSLLGYWFGTSAHLKNICITLSECAFVFWVLIVLHKIRIQYRITKLLGAISLEIYVMQGLCLSLFRSGTCNIENPYVYVVVVCVSTVVMAAAIHPVIKRIFSLCGGNRGGTK